jgi:hypothetical protein
MLTPAYTMNLDNATIDQRRCACGETFKAARTNQRAKCNPCYDAAGEEHCGRCAGTGLFVTGTVNGIPTGPGGNCFRCGGKGYQTPKDQRRNAYYDAHRTVSF